MRRVRFVALPVFALLLLTAGCGLPEKTELNERMIIEAVGVDRTDAGFAVTVQALNDVAVGLEEGVPENGVTKCCTFYGTTVGEALAQIAPRTGLTPLYSQARLLILGYNAAEGYLCEALDFFLREHRTRADITLAVAERTAKELVTASFGKNRVGADVLQDALRETGSGGAPLTPLYRFMNLLLSETDAAFCPLLGLRENEEAEDHYVICRGAVLFRGTKIGTVISADGLTALRALTEGLSGDVLTLRANNARCTLRVARCKTKVSPVRETGAATCRFRLRVRAVCDLTEISAGSFAQLTPEQIRTIEEEASRRLTGRLAAVLNRCFYENGCDVCRFYQRFRLLHPVRYRQLTAAGPLSPGDVTCEIECSVAIRRTGKEIIREQTS